MSTLTSALSGGDKELLSSQMLSEIHIIAMLTFSVVAPVMMYLVLSNCRPRFNHFLFAEVSLSKEMKPNHRIL